LLELSVTYAPGRVATMTTYEFGMQSAP